MNLFFRHYTFAHLVAIFFFVCAGIIGLWLKFNQNTHYCSNTPDDRQVVPTYDVLQRMDHVQLMGLYWEYINTLQAFCRSVVRVGSLLNGGKEICVDPGYRPQQPCVVYSFGINNQWDFDEAAAEMFGCNVYSFDPSMNRSSFRYAEKIQFFNWGLGRRDEVDSRGWQMKTLASIRRTLGHTNVPIDILKMDIEGDEWNAGHEMLSSGSISGVRQISTELHFLRRFPNSTGGYWGNVEPAQQMNFLRLLHEHGYRMFMRERNTHFSYTQWPGVKGSMGYITTVNEVSFIKV